MNDEDKAATGSVAPITDDTPPTTANGTRAVILVLCEDLDWGRHIAGDIADNNLGTASVRVFSVGEMVGNGGCEGSGVDCPETCALIQEQMCRLDWVRGTPVVCAPTGSGPGQPLKCVQMDVVKRRMADDRFTLDRVENEPDGHSSMPCVERHQNDREARGPKANRTSMEKLVGFPNGKVESSIRRIGPPLGHKLEPITVMIASNREELLENLLPRLARERDLRVVHQHVDDPALLAQWVAEWQPTVLLLDRLLLDRPGGESLRTINRKAPAVRVLLLWDEFCPGLVEEIFRHRFHGYLLASCPPDTYVKTIHGVSRGDIWLPRGVLAKAFSDLLQTAAGSDTQKECDLSCPDATELLTKREQQIVGLLSQGLTNKEIARRLDIMEDTVKKHLQHVFDKLGVRRRGLLLLRTAAGQRAIA